MHFSTPEGNLWTPLHYGALSSLLGHRLVYQEAAGVSGAWKAGEVPCCVGVTVDTHGQRWDSWGCTELWFDGIPPQGASSCRVTGFRGHCLLWELRRATVCSGGVDPEMCIWEGHQAGKVGIFLPLTLSEVWYSVEWASMSITGWVFPPVCGMCAGLEPGLPPLSSLFTGGRKRQVVTGGETSG